MPAPEPTWFDYLSGVGAIATPLLVLALTALGFKLRHQLERRSELEDRLRDDRINAYNEILETFVILLMSDAAWKSDAKNENKDKGEAGMQAMLSLSYPRQAFKMSLVASDGVVKAYNDLMQYVYGMSAQEGEGSEAAETTPDAEIEAKLAGTRELIALLGAFLLEIRKSMGTRPRASTSGPCSNGSCPMLASGAR